MNRRDFASRLATLPIISAVNSFASFCSPSCTSNPRSLQISLEGPFAVVVDSSSHKVTAFTPPGHGDHLFALNGAVYDHSKRYNFVIAITKLPSPPPPLCVQTDALPFCADGTQFNTPNQTFINIQLPAPQRIIVVDSKFKVDMQDNITKDVPLPIAHVLEYDVNAASVFDMSVAYDNKSISLQHISNPGGRLFRFEVGLEQWPGDDPDSDGSHATEFHNKFLLPNFPDLAKQSGRNISVVHNVAAPATTTPDSKKNQPHKGQQTTRQPRASKGDNRSKSVPAELRRIFTTTTFECKAGGLLVTSP